MRMRALALVVPLAAAALVPRAVAAGPTPQVTDPSGDANFVNAQGEPVPAPGVSAPVGSLAYGDVTAVLWQRYQVTKGRKKVFGGFTVTVTLSAPPVPPSGTTLVYRMLGHVGGDTSLFLGPVYYTTRGSDPATPQSALRDNLDGATRLTPLPLPRIAGSTLTWTVPAAALPKALKAGSTLRDLYFEVREIEDFHGAAVPGPVPVYGGASGLGAGVVDDGSSTSTFTVG